MVPLVLLGPLAGVFVDRVNRGRLIAWTDVAGGVLVSAAAALFFLVPGSQALLLAAVFVVSLGTGLLDTFSPPSINAGLHAAMLAAQGAEGILYRLLGAPLMVAANAVGYLRLGSEWLGYLMACYGGGGLIGFALAGMLPVRGRGREALVAGGTISPSTTVVIMLLLPGAPFQVALFLAAGVLGVLVNVHLMTLLQTASPPQLQGGGAEPGDHA